MKFSTAMAGCAWFLWALSMVYQIIALAVASRSIRLTAVLVVGGAAFCMAWAAYLRIGEFAKDADL